MIKIQNIDCSKIATQVNTTQIISTQKFTTHQSWCVVLCCVFVLCCLIPTVETVFFLHGSYSNELSGSNLQREDLKSGMNFLRLKNHFLFLKNFLKAAISSNSFIEFSQNDPTKGTDAILKEKFRAIKGSYKKLRTSRSHWRPQIIWKTGCVASKD